LSKNKDVFA
jgi:hypothetical protein